MIENKLYYNYIDLIDKHNVDTPLLREELNFKLISKVEISLKKLVTEKNKKDSDINLEHFSLLLLLFNKNPIAKVINKEKHIIKLCLTKHDDIYKYLEQIFSHNFFDKEHVKIINKSSQSTKSILIEYKFSNEGNLINLPNALERRLKYENPTLLIEIFLKDDIKFNEIKNIFPFWLI